MRLPLARSEGLVVEELGDEILVYDLDVKNAHCLSPTAARVWRLCDGGTSSAVIAEQLSLADGEITNALDELDRASL
ncbi:MAG: PqqD family peptide modification chaperone, partial [Solirubrobacteraceae bacterium]